MPVSCHVAYVKGEACVLVKYYPAKDKRLSIQHFCSITNLCVSSYTGNVPASCKSQRGSMRCSLTHGQLFSVIERIQMS